MARGAVFYERLSYLNIEYNNYRKHAFGCELIAAFFLQSIYTVHCRSLNKYINRLMRGKK